MERDNKAIIEKNKDLSDKGSKLDHEAKRLKKKESKLLHKKEDVQKEVTSNKQAADKIAANRQALDENEKALQVQIGSFELEKKKYEQYIQEVNAKEAGFKGSVDWN